MDGVNTLYDVAQQSHMIRSHDHSHDTLQHLKEENCSLKSQINSLESERGSLQEQVSLLKEENNSLQHKLSTCQDELSRYCQLSKEGSGREHTQEESPKGDNGVFYDMTSLECAGQPSHGGKKQLVDQTKKDSTTSLKQNVVHIKPLACDKCGKRFHKSSKLTKHLLKHSFHRVGSDDSHDHSTANNNIGRSEGIIQANKIVSGDGSKVVSPANGSDVNLSIKTSITIGEFENISEENGSKDISPANRNPTSDVSEDISDLLSKEAILSENDSCSENISNDVEPSSPPKLSKCVKRNSEQDSIKCNKCAKNFSSQKELTKHARSHRKMRYRTHKASLVLESKQKSNGIDYTCAVCDRKCLGSSHLINHMRSHTGEKPFSCEICGKRFARKSTLLQHSNVHKDEKPWECDTCHSKFSRKDALRHHQMTHDGEKQFECDICGKRFLHKSNMKKHQRIHTGEKPYTCSTCEKRFATLSQMKRHTKIHTGQRDFKCSLCGKSFIERQGLQNHQRIHTGEKPFSCDTCGKSFTERNNLVKHKRIHTGDRQYLCDTCGASFNRKGELLKHEKRHSEQTDTYRQQYELSLPNITPSSANIASNVPLHTSTNQQRSYPVMIHSTQAEFQHTSTINHQQVSVMNNSPHPTNIFDTRQMLVPNINYMDQAGHRTNLGQRSNFPEQRMVSAHVPRSFSEYMGRMPTPHSKNWELYLSETQNWDKM